MAQTNKATRRQAPLECTRVTRRDDQGRPIEGFLASRGEIARWWEARVETLTALNSRDVPAVASETQAPLFEVAA